MLGPSRGAILYALIYYNAEPLVHMLYLSFKNFSRLPLSLAVAAELEQIYFAGYDIVMATL